MSKEEQELSKVTYHAGNLIPNVIPSPKLAKSKKVSKSKKVKSLGLWNTNTTSELDQMLRNANQDEEDTGTRTGRRTKAQIQEDRIAEAFRRQEAGQQIATQHGYSITPICECESNETIEHQEPVRRRGKINGKMKFICNECELEWVSNASLSL